MAPVLLISNMKRETMKATNVLLIIIGILSAIINIGCGATQTSPGSSSDSSASASRIPVDTEEQSSKPFAYCNKSKITDLGAIIRTFVDSNSVVHNDFIRLNFRTLSSNFSSNNAYYIQFFRWKVSSANNIDFDSTPLSFRFESKSNFSVQSNYMTQLHWSTVKTHFVNKGVTLNSVSDLFNKYNIVVDLKDPDASYDVLKIALYNGTQSVLEDDMLLPIFHANPDDYATETKNGVSSARSELLMGLHPLKAMQGQGWSLDDFKTSANNLCLE